jgi:hypothetical protein
LAAVQPAWQLRSWLSRATGASLLLCCVSQALLLLLLPLLCVL